MITTRIAATLAGCALAVGILVGAAGMIVLRDATAPQTGFTAMAELMSSQGMSSMIMMNGSGASSMPGGQHDQHHPAASPEGSR